MIEIGERERPAILDKVQAHCARDVGKGAIPVVRVKNVALVPAPCAIRADEFVDRVPTLFVVVAQAWPRPENSPPPAARKNCSSHPAMGQTPFRWRCKYRESRRDQNPRRRLTTPSVPFRLRQMRWILKAAAARSTKQGIPPGMFAVKSANLFGRVFLKYFLG